jgi:hypothetical protein
MLAQDVGAPTFASAGLASITSRSFAIVIRRGFACSG